MAVLQSTSITGGLTMHGMTAGFVKLNAEGAVVIDTNSYLISGSFLPLSGGTMSGKILAVSVGTGTYDGAIELRETGYASSGQSAWGYSPAITFHWGNRYAKRFGMRADGLFAVDDEPLALRSWVSSQGYVTGGPYLSLSGGNVTGKVEFQYAVDRYSQAWRNNSSGAYWWVTTDSDKLGFHRNGDADKFYFSNGGDFWSSTNGWLSTALSGKLTSDGDSEQAVGLRYANWNEGSRRMNTDPRWNESGYDADLGCLHIWAWTAAGVAYGRAGIALYNGSAYQYLTTKASTTGMFINNTQIVTNSGTWSINVTGNSATTSQTNFSSLTVNNKHVRDSSYRTYSGSSDYYSGGSAGWYTVAQITLTSNCSGAVIYGTLYDHRYDGADTYQIAVVARADCEFTSNNEAHYINVGCTILGSTYYTDYRSKIRVILSASSSGSRTYELQFYESAWNNDTWQLETTGWTIYTTPQAPSSGTGTARVNYISNQSADYQRANTAMYSPIYYDSQDTAYYVDPNNNSKLLNLGLGNVTPDVRLSVNGDSHISGILYMGGTAGSYNSWGSRTYTSSGLWYNNSNGVEFNNYGYGSTWSFTINGGNAISSGSMRAPIFYDSNDTTYYLDPNAATSLNIAGKITTAVSNGTILSHGSMTDAIGYNNSYGTYIGSVVGGTYYIYANGQMYNNGPIVTLLHTGNYTSYTYSTSDADSRFLRGTTNPGSVNNFTISIGNNGSYSYVQSHSGQALYLNPVGNSIILNSTTSINGTLSISSGTTWFSGGATIGLENQSSFARFAFYGLDFWDWDHGRQMLLNGNYVYVDNYLQAGNSLRAPIFYDSNDTTYYLDPNSSSRLRYLYVGDGGSNWSNPGGWDTTLYISGVNHAIIRVENRQNNYHSALHSHTGQLPGVGSPGDYDFRITRNWDNKMIFYSGYTYAYGYLQAADSLRAPIFYDSQDTTYYLDLNSSSDSALRIRGGALFGANSTWGKYLYVGTNGRVGATATVAVTNGNLHIDCEDGYALYLNWYSTNNIYSRGNFGVGSDSASYRLHVHGTGYATSDFRAPIFYDSENTAYYGDFASTSRLNVLDANSIYTSGGLSTNGGNSLLGVQSPGGASRANGGSTETGAFKITFPAGIPVYGMFKLVIHIYEYGQRGNGYEIHCGGHMYPNYMYNRFQVQYGSSNTPLNVRYGNDGTYGCIWIGNIDTTWSYPQIWVSEFMMGYSNTSWTTWRSGWNISLVTSYGNSGAMDGPYTCDYGYAASAGSASTSSQVTINYNDNSNANYQLLWGSGNNVYGTGGVYVNPADDRVYANYFSSAYYMDVYTSAGSDYLRITDNQVYRPNGGILYLNWSSNANVAITGSGGGNVGVGNNSPSYKMHVSGDIYANGGWLRVSGTSGLYFESYGGGWRMTGSSYIESYNSKSLHMNGASVDYVGSLYFSGAGHIQPNSGSYGALQMTSSKNGWSGIRFTDSDNNLMMNSNESGHHRNGYGWQFRWYNGSFYISTNAQGGGSEYTAYHTGNLSPITTSNIGSQSVAYASNAGTLSGVSVSTIRGGISSNNYDFYVNGDANTYYPVVLSLGGQYGMHRYSISRGYSDPAPWDPIGTGSHRGGLTLTFDASSDIAWGGNDKSWRIIQFSEQYTNMVAGMALPVTDGIIVWLRGGGAYYRFHGPSGINHGATVYYSGYTGANGASYPVRTSLSSVDGEIRAKWPIRGYGDGDMYVNNSRVLYAAADPYAYNMNQYVRTSDGVTFGSVTSSGLIRVNGNNNLYLDYNYGCSIVGVYSSYRYQGVFAMGDSYKLPIDGTGPGNLYGMAWSHPNAGGQAGYLDSHGLLVIVNGITYSAISNSIWARGDVTAYSDARVKTNIEVIENAVEKIQSIRGVTFNRTDLDHDTVRHAGVIAQEVLAVLPEVVTTTKDGMHSVAYGNMAALFIEAIKEQQTQIEDLKNEIQVLKENK